MNEKIKNLTKNPKLLIIMGFCGIALIFISSLIPSGENNNENTPEVSYTAEQYRMQLENDIKSIVKKISFDNNPTVVVTLESGIRYSYAGADQTDSSSSKGETAEQSSESKKQSYITVKSASGGEEALVVTEIMPEIRGVAIICAGGDNEKIAQKIQNAVTAALNITSKRVYISGGSEQ